MALRERVEAINRKLRRSLQRRGFVGSVRLAARMAIDLAVERGLFDLRHSIHTNGIVPVPPAAPESPYSQAVHYEPTPVRTFRAMISGLDLDYRRFAFVDFGCGKGRVLLLAARFGFRQVVGLELSPELIGVARDNLEVYRRAHPGLANVKLLCVDAARCSFPWRRAVLYFFNPFKEKIMRQVLERMERRLQNTQVEYVVVYFNPVEAHLFDQSPFLKCLRREPNYIVYRTQS